MQMKMLGTRRAMPLTRMVCGLVLAFPLGTAYSSEQYISFRATAYIGDDTVRLREVADLDALPDPWRQLAGDIAVAKLRHNEQQTDLRATRLAESARRQLPALTLWLRPDEIQTVTITREGSTGRAADSRPEATESTRCLELTRGLVRGDALYADSVRPVVCHRDRPIQSAHYDRSAQLARATHDLARGDTLAAIAPQRFAEIRRGENVTMVVQSGAITVTRTGASLTDTASGRTAILAAGSGNVLTVPVQVQPVR